MKKTSKISFVGDIMCYKNMINDFKKNNEYFDEIFKPILEELSLTDYLVGNLETPISSFLGYTNDRYCFNTPKNLLDSLKKANFKMLITANNHCLDRGFIGLKQTMKNIKKYNMDYVGTALKNENPNKIININGVKIGFLAYTYGTNYSYNFMPYVDNKNVKINFLKSQISNPSWPKKNIMYGYFLLLKRYIKFFIKKLIHKKTNNYNTNNEFEPVVDNVSDGEWIINESLLNKINNDIDKIENECDLIYLILHTGGQYNIIPGSFTEELFRRYEDNHKISTVVGGHPHCVQKTSYKNDKLFIYSLGNFCFSTKNSNINFDCKPDYSILINYYIDNQTKQIEKITFEIIKCIDENNLVKVYNTFDLYRTHKSSELYDDILYIYNIFTGDNCKDLNINKEYILKNIGGIK